MKHLVYLKTLLGYAFRNNPLLYLGAVLSVFSAVVELVAMTSLVPLAAVAAGQQLPQDSRIVGAALALGITPDVRVLLLTFIGLFVVRIVTQFTGQGLTLYLSKRLLAQ